MENYLAFYWDIVAKGKGTYKPSKDNIVAPFFPPLSKDLSSLEFFNKRYLAAHEAYLRKALSDQIFDGVKSKLLPLQAGAYHSTPPESACARLQHQLLSYHKVEEPEPDTPFGYQEVRQQQTTAYNRGPRKSAFKNLPYQQDPTKLTSSEGLEEVFNPPVHHWRQIIFSIPETISPKSYSRVYKTPQLESKSEGREPPDGDESDPPPSPTPPYPRKS